MNSHAIDISIIMATYNPVWENCIFTLDSILGQKDVHIELVITDDGSENNLFDRFESYFSEKGFNDYSLICHDKNQGTLKNYYDGLRVAKGEYVKLISPGDALFCEKTLNMWLSFLKKSDRSWSFGEAVYYSTENGDRKPVQAPAIPQFIDCYLSDDQKRCRWNYVVLEDVALGAAILCEKAVFMNYLKLFEDKVKYAEDVAMVAMMYDGILPAYFNQNVMLYEYGSGVSTGSRRWKSRIEKDTSIARTLLIERSDKDTFQTKMSKSLSRIHSNDGQRKKIQKLFVKGGFRKVASYRICPRKSAIDCSGSGIWWKNS
jgi:glycosyltransferase involved in cell wall biosynthesis